MYYFREISPKAITNYFKTGIIVSSPLEVKAWLIILSIITMVRHAQTFMLCTIYAVKRLRQLQMTSVVRRHFAESEPVNNRRAGGI